MRLVAPYAETGRNIEISLGQRHMLSLALLRFFGQPMLQAATSRRIAAIGWQMYAVQCPADAIKQCICQLYTRRDAVTGVSWVELYSKIMIQPCMHAQNGFL
eukprot:1622726-Pleurochrysis_carterae.AAC.2